MVAVVAVAALLGIVGAEPAEASVPGGWMPAGNLPLARNAPLVRLANGKALLVGGDRNGPRANVDRYDPATRRWTAVAPLHTPRWGHKVTLLQNGKVLVTGGYRDTALAGSAELYDPATNTWTETGPPLTARASGIAERLPNGKVLVAGGWGASGDLTSAELYDPATGTFTPTGSMTRTQGELSVPLPAGRVLVVGSGFEGEGSEVYRVSTGTWTAGGNLVTGRYDGAQAVALANGKVLVAGGLGIFEHPPPAELYDPTTNSFSETGALHFDRFGFSMTRLADGRVLAAGGTGGDSSAEIYDPATGRWDLTGSMEVRHNEHGAVLLGDGTVLVAGGFRNDGTDPYIAETETFDVDGIPIPDEKITPSVAVGGGGSTLVVWQDGRNGNPDVYGSFVSSNGVLLQPEGIPVSTAPGAQSQPTVAWNGSSFLVAWTDRRSGSADVYGTRLTLQGAVTNPAGKVISAAAGDQRNPIARANGATWLVAWEDGRGTSTDVYGTRVTSTGAISSPSGVPISTAVRDQTAPSIAANGTSWLVTWGDRRAVGGQSDVYATRVTTAGAVSTANGVRVSGAAGDQVTPVVAWNGRTYQMAWADHRGATWDVYGARTDATGTPLEAAGIPISVSAGGNETSPAVAGLGARFLVVWEDDRGADIDLYDNELDSSGNVLRSASGVLVSGVAQDQTTPAVGVNDRRWLVVWGDTRFEGSSDIFRDWVSQGGPARTGRVGMPVAT